MGTHCSHNLSKAAEHILFSLCFKLGSSNMFWEKKKKAQTNSKTLKIILGLLQPNNCRGLTCFYILALFPRSTHKACVVVAFSLLMHLSPFKNHTDASGLGSLKMEARGRKGTLHHLGKIPEQAVEYRCYPCVCICL